MKRCAKCDHDYDDAYDACPRCAKDAPSRRVYTAFLVMLGLGVLILLLGFWPAGLTLIAISIIGALVTGVLGFFRGIGEGYRERSE